MCCVHELDDSNQANRSVSPGGNAQGDGDDSISDIGLHSILNESDFPTDSVIDQGSTSASGNQCLAIVPVGSTQAVVDYPNVNQPGDFSGGASDLAPTAVFAGLINSGMTCYMNSLLQTLFMTPEFRNALYLWRFEGTSTEAVTSIPYQLQRLFVQLYTTKSAAVSTNGVTTSFGWRSADVTQQQDIHELCRVMFDALEKKLGTSAKPQAVAEGYGDPVSCTVDGNSHLVSQAPTHDLINRLYQGQRSDCVRCIVCNRVSCRMDTFLDIQVPLRPFDLNADPYESLETAFRALIKPERLDGSNQYYCSRCKTKRDAERVCVFHRMPYLLTLQLMRFTFDLTTLNRIKINDRFTFPLDRWDLSEFITALPTGDSQPTDDEGEGSCCEEDGADYYPETENEYDHLTAKHDTSAASYSGTPCKTENLSNDVHRVVDDVSDEFEGMDTANGDSGVNSTITDSPYDAGSPTVGSPPTSDKLDGSVDTNSEFVDNPTITASLLSGFAFERAVASVVGKHALLTDSNGTDSLHTYPPHVDTDEDDGFGTGDARSACSSASTTNSSSVNGTSSNCGRETSDDQGSTACVKSGRPLNASYRSASQTDITPTKDQMSVNKTRSEAPNDSQPPAIYELFSIMVHSGFINGGHYYAYIRSFTDGQWYCFNDKTVTRATQSDLEETFGSNQSSYTNRANAYFLMYRRVDPRVNETFLRPDQFPKHIREMMSAIQAEEADAERKRELELSICKFEAHTRAPSDHQTVQAVVSLYRDHTLQEAANIVRETLLPDYKELSAPHCRIVQYATSSDSFGKSADYVLWHRPTTGTAESQPMFCRPFPPEYSSKPSWDGDTSHRPSYEISGIPSPVCTAEPTAISSDPNSLVTVGEFCENKRHYPFKLWLEHRLHVPGSVGYLFPSQSSQITPWPSYEPKGITLHVARVDIVRNLVYPAEKIWLASSATVHHLMHNIWQLYTNQPYLCPTSSERVDDLSDSPLLLLSDRACTYGPCRSYASSLGLPDWSAVVYDNVDKTLADLFPDSVADLSNTYCYRKIYQARVYVDLGARFDEVVAEPPAAQQLKDGNIPANQSNVAKRGRWQVGLSLDQTIATACRLRRMAAVIDEHLFHVEVSLELPSEEEVRTKNCLFGPFSSANPSVTASNTSSVDSGCSLTAHHGSPVLTGLRCSSSFQSSRLSSPVSSRRRSNSQSQLDELIKADRSLKSTSNISCSSSNIHVRRPTLLTADLLAGMHVDEFSVPLGEAAKTDLPTMSVDCCADCITLCKSQFSRRLKCTALFISSQLVQHSTISKMDVCLQHRVLQKDFDQLLPSDTLQVIIDFKLEPGTMKLDLRVLDLTGLRIPTCEESTIEDRLSPVWPNTIPVLCHFHWTVDHILFVVASILRSVYHIHISRSCLRLRKCSFGEPTPGPVLDAALSLSNFYNPHQCLMVQLLSDNPAHCSQMSPECVPKADVPRTTLAALVTTGYVFVRRWYPASLTFDSDWYEVFFPAGADRTVRWTVLVNWICTHSGLTADRLSIARCNFPGVSHRRHMYSPSTITSGPVLTWHSGASFDQLLSPVPNNGQVVYYKDIEEDYTHCDCEATCLSPNSDGHHASRTDGIESILSSDSFPYSQNFSLGPPVFGPELPCSQNYPGLTTSSSHDNMLTYTRSYDYEQPLRIYTAEDVLPSTSTRPCKGDQSSTTRPCTLRPAKPRESLTP
ncbi:ubiquitin carboxyl-terminal hydrolase 47 [Paragonimus westermani]|uniref:Ubiquitin carboxyl-terminal hydrolase 47 n=1 Tax=Paragonimus westermani TaxID=34504 RepID=A0A5J4NJI6_9TREM|nr:ubiquitin carboxyl-terminal hydrolase 47 [Paragonimus westermani]